MRPFRSARLSRSPEISLPDRGERGRAGRQELHEPGDREEARIDAELGSQGPEGLAAVPLEGRQSGDQGLAQLRDRRQRAGIGLEQDLLLLVEDGQEALVLAGLGRQHRDEVVGRALHTSAPGRPSSAAVGSSLSSA